MDLENRVRTLLAQNQRSEAIKWVLHQTGWGLRERKDYVDQLSNSASTSAPPLRNPGPDLSQHTISQIRALLAEDRKVKAVRLVRTMAGVGLREAKEYVDSLEARGDLDDEEPIDEQKELTRLRTEAAHLTKELDLLRVERACLEGESDRLLADRGRLRARQPRVSKRHKVRRNALCPCGSGKKYKKCCGKRR